MPGSQQAHAGEKKGHVQLHELCVCVCVCTPIPYWHRTRDGGGLEVLPFFYTKRTEVTALVLVVLTATQCSDM